jgi:hypothetical protein
VLSVLSGLSVRFFEERVHAKDAKDAKKRGKRTIFV